MKLRAGFLWGKKNHDEHRKFLSFTKKEALRVNDKVDHEELQSCPPLSWSPSEDMWIEMIDHWCTESFKAKSIQGTTARMSTNGRDGWISKSACGRIDITDRQLRELESTGKHVPVHKIISDTQRKRDATGKLTGEVVDCATHAALLETEERYREDPSVDLTEEYVPDEAFGKIYADTEVVKERGLKKGRILGLGSVDQALPILKLCDSTPSSSSGVGSSNSELVEELAKLREVVQQQAELEAARQEEMRVMKENYDKIMLHLGLQPSFGTQQQPPVAQHHQSQPSPWTQPIGYQPSFGNQQQPPIAQHHQTQPSPWTQQQPPIAQHHQTQPSPWTQPIGYQPSFGTQQQPPIRQHHQMQPSLGTQLQPSPVDRTQLPPS